MTEIESCLAAFLLRLAVLGQGCGKTTLVEQLEALFEHTGGKAAVFSMDDCYLTRADQEQLGKVSRLVFLPCLAGHSCI